MKTILITDAGGRGAALVDTYAKSKSVGKIIVVPGNDLMQLNTTKPVITYPHLKTTSVDEIVSICQKEKVDLIDVSQDNAVEVGLVNALQKAGFVTMGPTKEAGRIEWDKAWAREFMKKYNILSPTFYTFTSEKEGIDFAKKHPDKKWFIKASGLAEGKGAIPGSTIEETIAAIKEMRKFGVSGKTYLLEEWLTGEEFSAFAICDGKDYVLIGTAQDHKRVFNGDQGENTGGMGCVSNPLIFKGDIITQTKQIFEKTIKGLQQEGYPYKGVLYLGGMVVNGSVFIIEFNARWGDPEAQVLLPSIKNDLYEIALAIHKGNLRKTKINLDRNVRVAVALCSKGYPVDYSQVKGKKVFGIDQVLKNKKVKLYGAGIKKNNEDLIVSGGRVLYIVGAGKNVLDARKQAYEAMSLIYIEGNNLHYRTDIGWRDIEREFKIQNAKGKIAMQK